MPEKQTPMQKQFREVKARHPDCIIFFRLGDFYEMFYEDARRAAAVLDLVLTARGSSGGEKVPMCGVPFHAADTYLARLVRAGHKVAVCEQVEDPARAKGIVRREVVRVVTAGTLLEADGAESRCLAAFCRGRNNRFGFAFIDTTGGVVRTNQYPDAQRLAETIARLPVAECIYPGGDPEAVPEVLRHPLVRGAGISASPCPDWFFKPDIARRTLLEHFRVAGLGGFELEDKPEAVSASGGLLHYLAEVNRGPTRHVDRLALYSDDGCLYLSAAACEGLEIESLIRVMDCTLSPMGRRLLRESVCRPLKDCRAVRERQAAVKVLAGDGPLREKLAALLKNTPDLERALSRIGCGYRTPRDVIAAHGALARRPDIARLLDGLPGPLFKLRDVPALRDLLERALNPDPPAVNPEGRLVRKGFSAELDGLRETQENGRRWLRELQAREIARTGINSLKIGYNRVFGYYIEVSKANASLVPGDYIRKQTLVGGERYTLPELSEFEEKMLAAREGVLRLEEEVLDGIRRRILDDSAALHDFCADLARLDMLLAFARRAVSEKGFTCPEISDGEEIVIRQGRHPVVEKSVDGTFVPNDLVLDRRENHLLVITGPNMAGKSTFIRQAALLVIMAQTGSFIPAASASIGLVDRVFTRIGARDEISRGQSTFMVEMSETAGILNNLSERSLVVLDEIGRGTSTFDGLSLAWAVAEYLQERRVRTLFATHFHELTALDEKYPGVKNFNVAVRKWRGEIAFLHRIVPGGTDDSYGIHVARLAGVPAAAVERARQLLKTLELKSDLKQKILGRFDAGARQLSLFEEPEKAAGEEEDALIIEEINRLRALEAEIRALEIDRLTPLEALNLVSAWRKKISRDNPADG